MQIVDAGSRAECTQNKNCPCNMCYCVSGLTFRNCEYNIDFPREIGMLLKYKMFCVTANGFFTKKINRELVSWCFESSQLLTESCDLKTKARLKV